jgi:hypothetical protein
MLGAITDICSAQITLRYLIAPMLASTLTGIAERDCWKWRTKIAGQRRTKQSPSIILPLFSNADMVQRKGPCENVIMKEGEPAILHR